MSTIHQDRARLDQREREIAEERKRVHEEADRNLKRELARLSDDERQRPDGGDAKRLEYVQNLAKEHAKRILDEIDRGLDKQLAEVRVEREIIERLEREAQELLRQDHLARDRAALGRDRDDGR
jgi:Fe-S cluster assembly ATPase SufC